MHLHIMLRGKYMDTCLASISNIQLMQIISRRFWVELVRSCCFRFNVCIGFVQPALPTKKVRRTCTNDDYPIHQDKILYNRCTKQIHQHHDFTTFPFCVLFGPLTHRKKRGPFPPRGSSKRFNTTQPCESLPSGKRTKNIKKKHGKIHH